MCVVPIFRDEKGRDLHDLRWRLGSAAIWNTHSVWPVLVLLQRELRGAPVGRLLALPCGQWCGALLPDHSGQVHGIMSEIRPERGWRRHF